MTFKDTYTAIEREAQAEGPVAMQDLKAKAIKYRGFSEVLTEALKDPEYAAEWRQKAVASEVALWSLKYRRANDLTQKALADLLGWKQPVVARLEVGEHTPTFETLDHLARTLGLSIYIGISPARVGAVIKKAMPGRGTGRPACL